MNRLKQLRKEKSLTLDDLAAQTGIKRGTINNYENGKTEPKGSTWQKLATALNVSVPYLQGISDSNITAETWEKFDRELNDDLNEQVTSISDLSLHNKLLIVSIVSFLKAHDESVTDTFYSFMVELIGKSELADDVDREKLNQLFNEFLDVLDQAAPNKKATH